jgi:hypothetical protein
MAQYPHDESAPPTCPDCGAALRVLVEPGLRGPVWFYVCPLHGLVSAAS